MQRHRPSDRISRYSGLVGVCVGFVQSVRFVPEVRCFTLLPCPTESCTAPRQCFAQGPGEEGSNICISSDVTLVLSPNTHLENTHNTKRQVQAVVCFFPVLALFRNKNPYISLVRSYHWPNTPHQHVYATKPRNPRVPTQQYCHHGIQGSDPRSPDVYEARPGL